MAQQNFYIPDEDEDLLERVKKISERDSMSGAIVEALRWYVEQNESETEKLRKEIERRLAMKRKLEDEIAKLKMKLKETEGELVTYESMLPDREEDDR